VEDQEREGQTPDAEEGPDVEGHSPRITSPRIGANPEPESEEGDEVEAHSPRITEPRIT
jgi:hypothetical protein